jgi:putative tryptophan/tyrosine transport system substrate-binding protein
MEQNTALQTRWEPVTYRIAKGDEIVPAINKAQGSGATALNVLASPLLFANRQIIMDRVAAAHLPTIYDLPERAEEGGFAAYGPRINQLFLEVMVEQVIKLFRGSKVVDIPIEQPTKFELVINLKTAKAMGVTVPETLLVRRRGDRIGVGDVADWHLASLRGNAAFGRFGKNRH